MTGTRTAPHYPEAPFRGLEPYRFSDQAIFFERDADVRKLVQLTTIYRASLLYGESGAGKSSLINAGFLPRIFENGMSAERIRVQPRLGSEFIVERIESSSTGEVFPSLFIDGPGRDRAVLSADELLARIRGLEGSPVPALIFDQFEEFHTLAIDEAAEHQPQAMKAQHHILETLEALLRAPKVAPKLLFVFREDYLAKFDRLFYLYPDLPDHFLRLTPPQPESLMTILRGPFETDRLPKAYWPKEITKEVALRLEKELQPDEGRATINLARTQIVALQLWRSNDPEGALMRRGAGGLISDYLESAVARFGPERPAAESVLASLITHEGTRKVVMETDALDQVQREEGLGAAQVGKVLTKLVTESKLVRRDFNRSAVSYEIVNEFLVPWIRTLKIRREARRTRNRWLLRGAVAAAVFAAILGAVFVWKYSTTTVAARERALVNNAEKRRDAAEKEATDARARLSQTLQALASGDKDQLNRQLAAQVEHLQKAEDSQRAREQQLNEQVAAEERSLNDAQSRIASLTSELNGAQSKIASITSESSDAHKQVASLTTELNDARSKAASLAAEVEKLKTAADSGNRKAVPPAGSPMAVSRGILPTPAGKTYALSVGISNYPRLQGAELRYSAADAEIMAQFLESPRGGSADVQLLENSAATRAGILSALEALRGKTGRADTVVVAMSAIVVDTILGQEWILPYDGNPEAPELTGVSLNTLKESLDRLTAGTVVAYLNLCTTHPNERAARNQPQPLGAGPNSRTLFLFASGPSAGVNLEGAEFGGGHSAFIYFVILGLRGNADANKDGQVTRGELESYVRAQVADASRGKQRLVSFGNLRADAVLADARKAGISLK